MRLCETLANLVKNALARSAMLAVLGLAILPVTQATPAAAQTIDINNCKTGVYPPIAGYGQMINWTIVTCDRPTYIVTWTTIRRELFLPGVEDPVVANNIDSYFGFTTQLLVQTKCQRPLFPPPGFGGFFYATTWVSVTYQGTSIIGTGTSPTVRASCSNGSLI